MEELPPVRTGFFEKQERRVIAATVFGVFLSAIPGLFILEYYLIPAGK